MNYADDVKINENDLDLECLDQAALMLKYTTYEAEMERRHDLAKEQLDFCKSDLDKRVRENPENFDITVKITEAVILNTVVAHHDYVKVYHEVIDARYELNVSKGVVKAFAQRKDMLETLQRLYGQQYFAGPSVPRDLQQERENKSKRVAEKIKGAFERNRMNRGT